HQHDVPATVGEGNRERGARATRSDDDRVVLLLLHGAQLTHLFVYDEVHRSGLEPKDLVRRGAAGQSLGRAIFRWASASSRIFSSTPISFATSRMERSEAAASFTISPALS